MAKIDFYFDVISPYAFLAWKTLHDLPALREIKIQPRPVLLGGLLRSVGSLGPAEIPIKRQWVYRDVMRTARLMGLEMRFPPQHPFSSLLAMRALTLVAQADPEQLTRCCESLLNAVWQGGQDLSDWDAVKTALQIGGVTLDLSDCQTPEVKEELKNATDAAIARGVFGVPSMVIDDEIFWGHDRVGHLAHYLQHGDVLDDQTKVALSQIPDAFQV